MIARQYFSLFDSVFREGTIKIGDRVLAINGINVTGSTLQNAYSIMRQCRGTTLFLIEYDVAIVGSYESIA